MVRYGLTMCHQDRGHFLFPKKYFTIELRFKCEKLQVKQKLHAHTFKIIDFFSNKCSCYITIFRYIKRCQIVNMKQNKYVNSCKIR